jgi:hypothetical protein
LVTGLFNKYGAAFGAQVTGIDQKDPNNLNLSQVFSTSLDLTKSELKSNLKKSNNKITNEEVDEAFAFYLGLKDKKVIELTVITIGISTEATTRSPEQTTGASKAAGKPLQTENAEFKEFFGILQNTGFNQELGDAVFNGTTTSSGAKIETDNKGTNWVYFKNESLKTFSSNGNTKGHLILNITNKLEAGQIDILQEALPEVTKTITGEKEGGK